METTTPTARERFVEDFTLVIDNNYEAYIEATNDLSDSVAKNSERIKEGYETAISEALEVLRQNENVQEATVDLMAQILLGWGSDAFDDIARHYMNKEGILQNYS